MKIILNQDVKKLGKKGDVVEVAKGYARNYLLPQKLGIKATEKNILVAEKMQQKRQASIEENIELANSIKEGLADAKIVIAENSTDEGTLYASVSNESIIEAIEKFSGYKIVEDQIADNSIKEIGLHNVTINLSGDVSFEVTLEIVPET
ncbi:MAG: 50S ribosomal protein L9 [Actinobacteria bacterium]|nr:50S ribosomal protein L9 [Actinomycetota bacterium]|tara:strand:+ start:1046 stop:1492 length:447 start_codon:yes stop_codon:yes gene_type:complete